MSGLKKSVIRNMELLIIDEVSMLRADLLDAMDYMMQTVRKKSTAFGGVQVLYIGDLLQLPPVIRDEEWRTLKSYYKGKFFSIPRGATTSAIIHCPRFFVKLMIRLFRFE
jgi:hypothetical protein